MPIIKICFFKIILVHNVERLHIYTLKHPFNTFHNKKTLIQRA